MLDTVVIGAGPYGLSISAHLRHKDIPFRIFGRPMDSWLKHMPKGMKLKSDGFASDIYDPEKAYTLRKFCAERGIEYGDTGIPVHIDTFTSYGLAFKDRMVPELEDKVVTSVDRVAGGFNLRLDDGESFQARRVVLAVGITHFDYIPENLASLPPEYLWHSSRSSEVAPYRGRKIVVIGGGSSALDWAGLLKEAGADVELVARRTELVFHNKPTGKPRSLWQEIRHPKSGLGPGMRSRFYSDAPGIFFYLPEQLRVETVRRALGPSGGWFVRDMVIGKLPLHLGCNVQSCAVRNGQVHVELQGNDGTRSEIVADHVIAATGYRVNLERLQFLNPQIRSSLKTLAGSPVLSPNFESSVPGLYFAGVAAANSFGPVMRFAFGAGFAARRISRALARSVSREAASAAVSTVATTAK
jgi:thioredoxin reductase